MELVSSSSGFEVFLFLTEGPKWIDTKVKVIEKERAVFNEKFQMKTVLEYDFNTGHFAPKMVIFAFTLEVSFPTCQRRLEWNIWRSSIKLGKLW